MERRCTDRVPAEVAVVCRVPASPERARLIDLSQSGCRLEFGRHNIDAGATVNLDFRTGKPVGGEVVWTDGGRAGVRFHCGLPRSVAIDFGLEPPRANQLSELELDEKDPGARHLHHWMRR